MNIFNKQPFLIGEIGVNFYDIAKKENISDLNIEDRKSVV